MRAVWVLLVGVACGSSESTQGTATNVSPIATQQGTDDVIVAQVNGRPVWGSCVTAQARGKTKQAALDDCIAFELLAQEAEARGFAKDAEVGEATRAALVNRVVEIGFEDHYKTPADLADVMSEHIDRNKRLLSRPEMRASAYARINLPKNVPPADDWKARELMDGFAAKLANEEGLTAGHLDTKAKEYFGTTKVEVAVVEYFPKKGLALGYRDALFDIGEVGRIHPQAVRTQWGWDVILLTDVLPAKAYTREEAAVEAFPEVRRGYFSLWVDEIAKALGVKIEIDDKQVAKLDQVGP
jgi:hypothetical protein